MGSADDIRLVSGIDDRIPRLYEVQKGQKTQSYISAITGTPLISESVPPLCQPDKVNFNGFKTTLLFYLLSSFFFLEYTGCCCCCC